MSGNARRRLGGQVQAEFREQHAGVFFRLRLARQDEPTSIGGRHPDVNHLNAGELFQNGGGCQARRVDQQAVLERDLKRICQESNQDMRIHPALETVKDRADTEFALQ